MKREIALINEKIAAHVRRAEAIQAEGLSLELADLGVASRKTEDPNQEYLLPKTHEWLYTDGQAEYSYREGGIFASVKGARWVAQPCGDHVILLTELDNMSAAAAIKAWIRKSELKLRRLAYPAFIV